MELKTTSVYRDLGVPR